MPWSDKQLRAHKKASAGLSVATSTLGIGALGVAGARAGAGRALKTAHKAGRLRHVTPKQVDAFRGKSTGIQTGLLTASAGLGGIGGFNYAGIQNAEAKRSTKVAKRKKFTPTDAQAKQIERHRLKGEAVGTAAGLAATAAFPGVRTAARGSAKLSRALYQGSKAGTGGGRKAIGGKRPPLKLRAAAVGQNAKLAGSSAAKGASTGGLYLLEKHPKQAAGAFATFAAGSQTGSQVGYSRKRGELKRAQGYKTTFIKKSADDLDMGLGWVRQGPEEVAKSYSPERKRARRLDVYNAGSNVAAGALGAGAVGAGMSTRKKALRAVKRTPGGKNSYLKLTGLGGKGGAGRGAAVTAALGIGAVGAAVGADRIQRYKRGNGRSYRPLHVQV